MRKKNKISLIVLFVCSITIIFTIYLVNIFDYSEGEMKKIKPLKIEETENLKLISKIDYPKQNYQQWIIEEDYVKIINSFAEKITKQVFKDNENEIFSPISLYIALSMLLEGVSNSSAKNELICLLGLEQKCLRQCLNKIYENNYYSNYYGRTYMANSIWISNNFFVKENYSKILKNHYFAENYYVNFKNMDSKKKIIKWLNYYTEDMLNLSLENYYISDDLTLLLINTIYFNNNWLIQFDEKNNHKSVFNLTNEVTTEINYMMHQIETYYNVNEDYVLVQDYFENDNTITYIMPQNNNFSYNNIEQSLNIGIVNLSIPKFKFIKNYDLKEDLKELGVKQIFENNNSLENISKNLFVDYIRQNVGIDFSEKGVEATSITSIGINKTSLPHNEINIILDKPYYYIIKDANGIILFIGYVNNPITMEN